MFQFFLTKWKVNVKVVKFLTCFTQNNFQEGEYFSMMFLGGGGVKNWI